MKKTYIFGIILLILGVVLALMPQIILPACDKGIELANGSTVPMKCHWTGIFCTILGAFVTLSGILALILRNAQTQRVLGVFSILFAVTAILTATCIVGVCKNAIMPCRMGTLPGILVISVLIIAVSILQIIANRPSKKERPVP